MDAFLALWFGLTALSVISAIALLSIRERIVKWALRTRQYPVDITSDWRGRYPSIKFDQVWGQSSRALLVIPEGRQYVLWARFFWILQYASFALALMFLVLLLLGFDVGSIVPWE